MSEIKTDPKLLEALKASASRQLSADEIERQRISFVMGMLDANNPMTREDVKRVLDRHNGREAA